MNKRGIIASACLGLMLLAAIAPGAPEAALEPGFAPPRPEGGFEHGSFRSIVVRQGLEGDGLELWMLGINRREACLFEPGERLSGQKGMRLFDSTRAEVCTKEPLPEPEESGECIRETTDLFDFDISSPGPVAPFPESLEVAGIEPNPFAARAVSRNIDIFTGQIRDRFSIWLTRASMYLGMMKQILKEEGVPEDIAFLPLIESGFNTRAYSRSRAAGPWQFIAGTARRYGLKVNWWVDERRDPVKSTRAAARYLRDLHEMFGSWSLALAAYNAGENKVKRAIRKTGSEDFWALIRTRHLKRETKNYVPKFIAARHIAINSEDFGFEEVANDKEFAYDEVTIEGPLTLDVIAKCSGITVSEVKELNPELRRWSTPPNAGEYTLRLPPGTGEKFSTNLAGIPDDERYSLKPYVVKRGDTVAGIARKTGVSVSAIISYNKLGRKALIHPGQRLLLPLTPGYRPAYIQDDLPTVSLPGGKTARQYTVRRGDTLYQIARKIGVSVNEILKLNRLGRNSLIRVGQRILLPGTALD